MNIEEFKTKKEEFKRLHLNYDYFKEDDDVIYAYMVGEPVVDYNLIGQLKKELRHESLKIKDGYLDLCYVNLCYNDYNEDFDKRFAEYSKCCIVLDTQYLTLYFNNKDYLVDISVGIVDGDVYAIWNVYKVADVDSMHIEDFEV